MPFRCAVLDDYQRVAASLADWNSLGDGVTVEFFHDHVEAESALVERLSGFDAVVAMRERTEFRARILERLPRLRLILTTGMRNAAIDLDAAHRLGVTVCGTQSSPQPPLELTWALILAAARRLPLEQAGLRQGGPWQQTVGEDLCGRTLGLVGLGKIGSRPGRGSRDQRALGRDASAERPRVHRPLCTG